jgi:preprotein translocase subunit SecY
LIPIIPSLERRLKENPREGQIWQERWTIILTIPMAILSAIGQINIFSQLAGRQVLPNYGFTETRRNVDRAITMVEATTPKVWLGR